MIKSVGKKMVLFCLRILVRWRLRKIDPEVIGITGSVGKTSTKDAIFQVISQKITTYRNKKSLNTEFGAFLAILEQESGYSSPLKWISSLWKGSWGTLFLKNPYKILVLEMGADKPGDIGYLVENIPPQIGILTNVKEVHMAEGQFPSIEAIFEEKSKLVRALPKDGIALLNADDKRVISLAGELDCRVLSFGMAKNADFKAEQMSSNEKGVSFEFKFKHKTHSFHFPQLLGKHQIYMLLPAIAVGLLHEMSLSEIEASLKKFQLPPGRMNLIEGIEGSTIIDSSYNASPDAMVAALEVLKSMPGRKIAALGSMNELGQQAKALHLELGEKIPHYTDLLITVGENARYYAQAAEKAGLKPNKIHTFDEAKSAGEFLKKELKQGDFLLTKGSQNNVRMEYLVHAVMKYPEKAKSLLVRQDNYWQTH